MIQGQRLVKGPENGQQLSKVPWGYDTSKATDYLPLRLTQFVTGNHIELRYDASAGLDDK
jgi:hypothetical protein